MEYLTDEVIENIENEFVPMLIKKYNIDTSHLVYDATNFFTFLSQENESELAQNGHNKAGDASKKIVGLSMFVTPDYNLPLMYDVYPGNTHDSIEFRNMLDNLSKRYEKLFGKKTDITVTFDRGNNSDENITKIIEMAKDMHYVGGLRISQLTSKTKKEIDYLGIPLNEYITHNKKDNVKIYRTSMNIYGSKHTVLLMHDDNSYKKQLHTLENNIAECIEKLEQLNINITTPNSDTRGRKRTKESTNTAIKKFFSNKEHVNKIIDTEVVEENGIVTSIKYKVNEESKENIKSRYLGKRALYTNRNEWTNEEIENSYSASCHVEHGFRQMKNDECINVRPMFHWTDNRIKVHMFYFIMAYRICCILRKQLQENGVDISINKMIEKLGEYKKITTVNGLDIIESMTIPDEKLKEILHHLDRLKRC